MNVNSILAAARDEGIIQFRIKNSISECVSLQSQLVAKFGFAEAIVVPSATDWRMAHVIIGHVVGEYLQTVLVREMSLRLDGDGQSRPQSPDFPNEPCHVRRLFRCLAA